MNENLRQMIVSILMQELDKIYCYNCRNEENTDNCDDCHRKYMEWKISEEKCEDTADKILELIQ